MTLEKQFTLEAADKPKTTNPIHQRRLKFVTALDKQVATLQAGSTGGRGGWVWQNDSGEWSSRRSTDGRRLSLLRG